MAWGGLFFYCIVSLFIFRVIAEEAMARERWIVDLKGVCARDPDRLAQFREYLIYKVVKRGLASAPFAEHFPVPLGELLRDEERTHDLIIDVMGIELTDLHRLLILAEVIEVVNEYLLGIWCARCALELQFHGR